MSNWSLPTLAVSAYVQTNAMTTATVIPNVGDLMVVYWGSYRGGTNTSPTGFAVTDTGSGGWTNGPFVRNVTTTNLQMSCGLAYKVAASSDNNSGLGITVTVTPSGGSGTIFQAVTEVDCYRLSSGTSPVLDLSATYSSGGSSVSTFGPFSPVSGSSDAAFTDELAIEVAMGNSAGTGAITSPSNFTGTSAAQTLTLANNNHNSSFGGSILWGGWAGGNQASATAGSNSWELTINGVVGTGCGVGVTFAYTAPPSNGNFFLMMGL